MQIYRATRYRIYPTAEQAGRMIEWQRTLRGLWNMALEQHKLGRGRHRVNVAPRCDNNVRRLVDGVMKYTPCGHVPRPDDGAESCIDCAACGKKLPYPRHATDSIDERVWVKYLDQQNALPEMRKLDPYIDDVPSACSQGTLRELDKAWSRNAMGLCGPPRMKSRHKAPPSLFCSAPSARVDGATVVFPKVGRIDAVIHRPVQGVVKTVQIQRDVDQWFAVVMCEIEVPEPAPHPGPAVGIDRGVVNLIADSDGRIVTNKFNSRDSRGGAACGGSGSYRPVRQEERVARPAPSGQSAQEAAPCAGEEAQDAFVVRPDLGAAPCAGEEALTARGTAKLGEAAPCAGEEAQMASPLGSSSAAAPCAGEEAVTSIAAPAPAGESVYCFADLSARILRAERDIARKMEAAKAEGRKWDGANLRKARERLAKLQRLQRRQREAVLQVESKRYAETYGTVVVEKLDVKAMSASAKGTAEAPGSKVRQKAGLNRSIMSAGWSKFVGLLRYKSAERGGTVVEVPAAYSSQTCHGCGHVAAENRPDQATFECQNCGLVEHADINAAKVILARGLAGQVATPKAPKKTLRVLKRKRKDVSTAGVQPVEACGGEAPVTAPNEAGKPRSKAETPQGAEHVQTGETSRDAA